jgi:hypothetical protein
VCVAQETIKNAAVKRVVKFLNEVLIGLHQYLYIFYIHPKLLHATPGLVRSLPILEFASQPRHHLCHWECHLAPGMFLVELGWSLASAKSPLNLVSRPLLEVFAAGLERLLPHLHLLNHQELSYLQHCFHFEHVHVHLEYSHRMFHSLF